MTLGFRPACACPTAPAVPCVVLDPFCGSGRTGIAALEAGRNFIGIDAKAEYLDLAIQALDPLARQARLPADVPTAPAPMQARLEDVG